MIKGNGELRERGLLLREECMKGTRAIEEILQNAGCTKINYNIKVGLLT